MPDRKKQFGFETDLRAGEVTGFFQGLKAAFLFSLALLLVVVLGWVAMLVWEKAVSQQGQAAQAQLKGLQKERQVSQEKAVLDFGQQAKALEARLAKHRGVSPILLFLEGFTQPQVFYTNFDYSFSSSSLNLQGEAMSLRALSQQLAIFEQAEPVSSIELGPINVTSEGTVQFSLELTLQTDFGLL